MKVTELMLGDWVMNGSPHQLDAGDLKNIFSNLENDGKDDARYLSPIPLTAEILEKNGWKPEFDKMAYMVKYDLSVEGKNCWMMWATKEHNLDIQRQDEKLNMYNLKTQRVCIPCDYVHELQHAMRLCGINKDIEL